MSHTVVKLGPRDNGRRLSLDEFDAAEEEPGYRYELARGRVVVSEVPRPEHLAQIDVMREQLSVYRAANRDVIHRVAGGGECKIVIPDLDSERNPDLAIYRTPPPPEGWEKWVPDVAVEVVSPGSEARDYTEKREEYLRAGVREYWVVDADRGEVLHLRRHGGRWRERVVRPPERLTTRLLPGFELDIGAVIAAARG